MFPAHIISSQFNHAFVVVQPEEGGSLYRISIANKFGVRPYGPLISLPALYERGPKFRDFFLTKLINAERASMCAPDFRQRLSKTKEILLKHLSEKIKKERKGSVLKGMETVLKLGENIGAKVRSAKIEEKRESGSSVSDSESKEEEETKHEMATLS